MAHNTGMQYEKVYITVYLRVDRDGYTKSIEIEWQDGRRYEITKIIDKCAAPPRHVGGSPTIRYTVIIAGREKELYLEKFNNKWFVEKPVV